MPISHVKRGIHFPMSSSQIVCSIARGTGYSPYREIASILPGETANIGWVLEGPSLRLHILAYIDVVLASFERRKGIVLSTLAEIRLLHPRSAMG